MKNLHFKGLLISGEIESRAGDCRNYVDSVEEIMGNSDCDSELFEMSFLFDPTNYGELSEYPTLERIFGYERLCLALI